MIFNGLFNRQKENRENKEKPPVLYHGSVVFGIEEFKPRVISTPDGQNPSCFC